MTARLFVYGTLMSGQTPENLGDIVARLRVLGPATVEGILYNLGDYPGLKPNAGGVVFGQLVEISADELAETWRRLDEYEGVNEPEPLYRRTTIVAKLSDGQVLDCQTYVYLLPTDPSQMIPGGKW